MLTDTPLLWGPVIMLREERRRETYLLLGVHMKEEWEARWPREKGSAGRKRVWREGRNGENQISTAAAISLDILYGLVY